MARGAELVLGGGRGGCPPHTLYMNFSASLLADARSWSAACRAAFERALDRLCKHVVGHALSGTLGASNVAHEWLGRDGSRMVYSARCCGTRITITVSSFHGPHNPGPDGGARQLAPVDDRVLGVYGSAWEFRFVTFYGPLAPEWLVDMMLQLRMLPNLQPTRIVGVRSLSSASPSTTKKNISAPDSIEETTFNVMPRNCNSHHTWDFVNLLDSPFAKDTRKRIVAFPGFRLSIAVGSRATAPRLQPFARASLSVRQDVSHWVILADLKPGALAHARSGQPAAAPGQAPGDLQAAMRRRPKPVTKLIRQLKEAPEQGIHTWVRVVRDGKRLAATGLSASQRSCARLDGEAQSLPSLPAIAGASTSRFLSGAPAAFSGATSVRVQ